MARNEMVGGIRITPGNERHQGVGAYLYVSRRIDEADRYTMDWLRSIHQAISSIYRDGHPESLEDYLERLNLPSITYGSGGIRLPNADSSAKHTAGLIARQVMKADIASDFRLRDEDGIVADQRSGGIEFTIDRDDIERDIYDFTGALWDSPHVPHGWKRTSHAHLTVGSAPERAKSAEEKADFDGRIKEAMLAHPLGDVALTHLEFMYWEPQASM